jgi:tRNA-splicing ligase RtcB
LDKWKEEIKKEIPFAYKDISPIIKAHTDNKVADIVAEVKPILTIKA